jgi:hypothetical protein
MLSSTEDFPELYTPIQNTPQNQQIALHTDAYVRKHTHREGERELGQNQYINLKRLTKDIHKQIRAHSERERERERERGPDHRRRRRKEEPPIE